MLPAFKTSFAYLGNEVTIFGLHTDLVRTDASLQVKRPSNSGAMHRMTKVKYCQGTYKIFTFTLYVCLRG